MLIGYARVSTLDQDTSMQRDALDRAGVHRLFADSSSGVGPRPQLQQQAQPQQQKQQQGQ